MSTPKLSAVRFPVRGFLIGLVGVPVACYSVASAEIVLKTLQIGYLQMPPAVIGLLLTLILLNAILRKVAPRLALGPPDLLVAYSMMTVAAMISSRGWMEKLLPLLVTLNYLNNDGNGWHAGFDPFVKPWSVPYDPASGDKQLVAERFFERLRAGETIPWALWIRPLLAWSLLGLLVFGAFLCLASLLRRQWADNEKLSFPLVQLPMQLIGADESRELPWWKNRLLWLGFLCPFVVYAFKGLHAWYPAIPDISLEMELNPLFETPPWNGMYYTPLKFSFAVVGFCFLLPGDLLFSLWFFFVLSRLQDVGMRALNIDMPGMPMYPAPLYRGYQAAGASLVIAVSLLWAARAHLKRVFDAATGKTGQSGQSPGYDDSAELLPDRWAFWGFWVCALGAGVFLMFLGMSPWLAVGQLVFLFLVIGLIMARSTAEAGMLMTETSFRPVDLLRLVVPLHTLGPQNITALAFTDALLLRDQRSLLLAGFLDFLKMSDPDNEAIRLSRRHLLPGIGVAVLVSIVVATVIQLKLPYEQGGVTLYGYVYAGNNRMSFDEYQQHLKPGALPVGWQGPVFLFVGAIATTAMIWARSNVAGFALHPLAYALCSSWTLIVFWFSAFVAWALKTLILRYGGMKLFRQARPLFLGFILGEFTAALLWALANALLDTPVPTFPWA